MLCPTDATILFFRKNPLHVATVVDIYETRVESFDNGQIWKEGPNKLRENANQSGRNNNFNAGPKSDRIAKDTINAPKSRNSKNPNFVSDRPTIS